MGVPGAIVADDANSSAKARSVDYPANAELATFWNDLDRPDSARASAAIAGLASRPEAALALIRDELMLLPDVSNEVVRNWIRELDNDSFSVRDRATQNLRRCGDVAEAALRKLTEGQLSPEAKRRTESLLYSLEQPSRLPGRWRAHRLVVLLERIGNEESKRLLRNVTRVMADTVGQDAAAALRRLSAQGDGRTAYRKENEEGTQVEIVIVVKRLGDYLDESAVPIVKGTILFSGKAVSDSREGHLQIRASYTRTYNGFTLGYHLQGLLNDQVPRRREYDITELSGPSINYWDDLREARGVDHNDIARLVDQLYRTENKVQWLGSVLPGGDMLRFSGPMKQLMLMGAKARPDVRRCLFDPSVQNEAALVLGQIGDESTIPLLIDCYPTQTLEREMDKVETAQSRKNRMCLTVALARLTRSSVGLCRECADLEPGNANLWNAWWAAERGRFKVRHELDRGSHGIAYPDLSAKWAKTARRRFVEGEK